MRKFIFFVILCAYLPLLAAPPTLQLVSVKSQKVLYGTKDAITGSIVVKNSDKTILQTVNVSAWLETEIDTVGKAQTTILSIEPGKTATATFTWKKGLGKYGHAMKAEITQNATVIAKGEDYFNVCDNFWNVALPRAIGFMWDAFDQKLNPKTDTSWVGRYTGLMRNDYYNCFERFFWAQDDFMGMVPTKDVWWSGQARYRESKDVLKLLIDKSHEQGIKSITYAKLTGGGTYGMEMARRHPEWVWQYSGTLAVERNVKQIHDWDITTDKHWGGWVAVNYDINNKEVLDIGIKNLADSVAVLGWDGARWDGNFDVHSETYDLNGKLKESLTADQVDARNADNMRRTKEYLTKKYPQFQYGYNWTQGDWRQTMATTPRESIELCRGGGLIMNEYINQAESVQHPLHKWEVYAPSVADDVDAIKKLGGYYGPILSSQNSADGRYTNIFAYAAGAHPYYQHLWGSFVTRNSAFIWDNALTRIHSPENIIMAPSSVWWRNWVYERQIDKKHKQLIIHLINPPAKPTVGEGKKPEDVPPALKNVNISILPAMLDGWKPVRANRISPEPAIRDSVPMQTVEGIYKFTVPEVALWNILVVDMTKGGR